MDTKWLKDSKTNINKLTPISMKKMSQHQLASQGQVTEGATPLGIVEWLSAGAALESKEMAQMNREPFHQ